MDDQQTVEQLQLELDLAFKMLEIYGVSKQRARSVSNGIGVLVTRMDREIFFLKQELADLKRNKS